MNESPTYTFRAVVRYPVERVVYLQATNRAEASERARDTTWWSDALDPHEDVDRITVKECRRER